MALIDLELTKSEFAGGKSFGSVGPYEQLQGTATYALDPEHPLNKAVTDIALAPLDGDGRVRFSSDVRILRPLDAARSGRGLLLDVVNRGNGVALRSTDTTRNAESNPTARSPEVQTTGWPLCQGYTLVSYGWQHDVPRVPGRFGISVPEALVDGEPISGSIAVSQQFNTSETEFPLAYGDHVGYPVADLEEPGATLTEADYSYGPPRLVPRDRWRFARVGPDGTVVPDRGHVYFADGFTPGKIYEVVYTTRGAPLTGLGLAGTRDLASFLRFADAEAGNPCARQLDYALAIGVSQTGRFLRQMLYEGFCEDEEGRLALDGLLALIGGPIRTEANLRFGQPAITGPCSPGFQFPFADVDQTDPRTGRTDGLQHRARARGVVPRVMYINTSAEYSNLGAALIHVSEDAKSDIEVPENVRIYHFAGTQHGGGSLPLTTAMFGGETAYYNNSVDYRPLVRSALVNLDAWVTSDKEPPPSRYPRFDDGTLVDGAVFRERLARLPGPGFPADKLYPTMYQDFGPALVSQGYPEQIPPKLGGSYPELFPAVDDDGNITAGVRHPDVEVPLATYTGWNPRHPSIGGENMTTLLNGATIPFARTRAEREALGDPRPSIEERWSSAEEYVTQVRAAAEALVAGGYLLDEEVEGIVATARDKYDQFGRLESPLPADQR